MPKPMRTATGQGTSANCVAKMTFAKLITAPMLMSMPPVVTMINCAIVAMATGTTTLAVFMNCRGVSKPGLMMR
ncbi:unannotated protein [freshwater metagenome]|uniref:Unannotated protein n=1 Tax=freshwater metagenome TaxID=449393 RepID=A0A6J7EVQ4_9ZZZZ